MLYIEFWGFLLLLPADRQKARNVIGYEVGSGFGSEYFAGGIEERMLQFFELFKMHI